MEEQASPPALWMTRLPACIRRGFLQFRRHFIPTTLFCPGAAPSFCTHRAPRHRGARKQENGRLCRWWIFRGVSADGGTEWEEKTWETSDAFSYKEIGAEKSGRDSLGRVWREAWTERHDLDAAGVRHIWRSADKWAKAADQSQWHEKWNESFGADGRTERDAYKWGCLPPNETPQDGHAARWCEKWGEKWDGAGFASKWADKWGERDSREGGGQYRKWGDKWSQEFRDGKGHRWGETWGDDPDGRGWCAPPPLPAVGPLPRRARCRAFRRCAVLSL